MAIKIYTKTGDKGSTSLFGGTRVPKSHLRIESYGTIDELNSTLGLAIDSIDESEQKKLMLEIQHRLFTIGANLASDPEKDMNTPDLQTEDVTILELAIDKMNAELPELKHFILPSGFYPASLCHLARTICRRAERRIVALDYESDVDAGILIYLNRLSDYLFVLARWITIRAGKTEAKWIPRA
jgi:cob(I)alamin adenosyltransferase